MPHLFSEFALKDARLRNRVAVSPMCQYSAEDGAVTDWHLVHLGGFAVGGAGLVVAEAAAVSPEGRITPADAGLWDDRHIDGWARVARFVHEHGALAGVQIAHAGRKAGSARPWDGGGQLPAGDPRGWEAVGPSAHVPPGEKRRPARPMTVQEIARVQADFAAAARRALAAGFTWLEVHFAHGYLGQSFFSPLVNTRTDGYGGSFEGRARFLLETFAAVRAVWPERMPLTVRLGVMDYVDGEQGMEESIELIRRLAALGLDLIDVSLGFNTPDGSRIPTGEHGFLVPTAARVRRETGVPTATSWNITDPAEADRFVREGQLDLVMFGKAMLEDPRWACAAAKTLGITQPTGLLPPQYRWAIR